MLTLPLFVALNLNTASAASVDLAFAVQPEGPTQTWSVEMITAQEMVTRVPDSGDWELRLTMVEASGEVEVQLGLYEVISSRSGRERYRFATEQTLSAANGEPVALLYRPSESTPWMRKQRAQGARPTGLLIEVVPHV